MAIEREEWIMDIKSGSFKNSEIISVGTLQVGTAVNIIAGQATMSMNARSYDMESREITKGSFMI